MASKRVTYRGYKKKFDQILKDNVPIYDNHGHLLKTEEDEEWVQCYAPNDTVRKMYPKYYFVSNKGNLVSVKGKKPRWLTPSDTTNGRESYGFSINGEKHTSIGYLIVAVCFEAKTFGKADELMKKKGRDAFGKIHADDLQGHHNDGFEKNGSRAINNDPNSITILTINIHRLFKNIPSVDASDEEQIEFMMEMSRRVLSETEEPAILIPGSREETGTIDYLWRENITKFSDDKEWMFVPLNYPIAILKMMTEDIDLASKTEQALKEYCEGWLEKGSCSVIKVNIPFSENGEYRYLVYRKA